MATPLTANLNYHEATAEYPITVSDEVEVGDLTFFFRGIHRVPLRVFITQSQAVFEANRARIRQLQELVYQTIPDMSRDLTQIIAEYAISTLSFSIPSDLSYFPMLQERFTREYPHSRLPSSITHATIAMVVCPPSKKKKKNEVYIEGKAHKVPHMRISLEPSGQDVLTTLAPIIPTTTHCRYAIPTSWNNSFYRSSDEIQKHPLGGHITYLIAPDQTDGSSKPDTQKAQFFHLMIYQPPANTEMPDDAALRQIMSEKTIRHTAAVATMAKLSKKQQTTVVNENND